MRIERLTNEAGEALAYRLQERIELDGTYWLVQRPEDPTRYFISPAAGREGEYTVAVGLDPARGRVTLLTNNTHCVLMLGATTRPLV